MPYTFVFIGQSGSGKGEQSSRLRKVLVDKFPKNELFYMETGPNFREFIKGDNYSNRLSREITERGDIQPAFLAIHFWADNLLENFKGDEHIVFDGICRRLTEVEAFTTAMQFYSRKAIIIYINISRKCAVDRLVARGRADDKDLVQLNGRLDWFEEYTMPVIGYVRENSNYTLLEINGEQTIEEVHAEILKKLGW
jgi:adenylate kinase family enzyme